MKAAATQVLMIAGLALLTQAAGAAGMEPPASLLPPGYKPMAPAASIAAPIAAPGYAATDDTERTGMGEADLAMDAMPSEAQAMNAEPMPAAATEGTGRSDYIDVPPLAPMPPMAGTDRPATPQPGRTPNYTQGITTGPKAYSEGNFTVKY